MSAARWACGPSRAPRSRARARLSLRRTNSGRRMRGVNFASQDYLSLAISSGDQGDSDRGRAAVRRPQRRLGGAGRQQRAVDRAGAQDRRIPAHGRGRALSDRLGRRLWRDPRPRALGRPHRDRRAGAHLSAGGRQRRHHEHLHAPASRPRPLPPSAGEHPRRRTSRTPSWWSRRACSRWTRTRRTSPRCRSSAANTTPLCSSTWLTISARSVLTGAATSAAQNMLGKVDLVMGSFSKTFASNGGFVASHSRQVKEYLRFYSPTTTFSNALVTRSVRHRAEGLRDRRLRGGRGLARRIDDECAQSAGEPCARADWTFYGDPSAIVAVKMGSEALARLVSRRLPDAGLLANLVEYPAVAKGAARFRMQVMAKHSAENIRQAVDTMATCRDAALQEIDRAQRPASERRGLKACLPRWRRQERPREHVFAWAFCLGARLRPSGPQCDRSEIVAAKSRRAQGAIRRAAAVHGLGAPIRRAEGHSARPHLVRRHTMGASPRRYARRLCGPHSTTATQTPCPRLGSLVRALENR